jgi:hypothetical protein
MYVSMDSPFLVDFFRVLLFSKIYSLNSLVFYPERSYYSSISFKTGIMTANFSLSAADSYLTASQVVLSYWILDKSRSERVELSSARRPTPRAMVDI